MQSPLPACFLLRNRLHRWALLALLFSFSSVHAQMRITEYMYSGANGEFVEFTNVGNSAIDMTGWSFDDATRNPGVHSLTAFGTVQPGESVVVTETTPVSAFRTAWNLCDGIKVTGGYTNDNLGRADEINLYDASGTLIDRLTFNDQTLGGPRTQNKSAWVSAAGLGANAPTQWTLSATGDSEGSFASTGGDIGSPGKSKRATVAFNPCAPPVNGAPTIAINVATTSNFIDGGINTAPPSPFAVSAALSDPTDPVQFSGVDFTIGDDATPVNNLTVTVSSSNTTVVPAANILVSGSGASRNVRIVPNGVVGYSNISVTVGDGTNLTTYILAYAVSAASTNPAATIWHTGISDASDAISLDTNYFVTGDDEQNVLNVYSHFNSGLPLVSYNYTTALNLPDPSKPEVDVEAAAPSLNIAGRMYWLGSMSNGKSPFDNKPNRNRLFATSVTGTGAAATFSPVGYYGNLRATIISWGDAHGYGFSASAAAGVDSKSISGFAAEGMVFAPDSNTLYIGLRAPLVPTANRTKAVIIPLLNFETWFANGAPSGDPTLGNPIELDLGGRGIRDLVRLPNGTYLIVAGNVGEGPLTGAIYKWTGKANQFPVLVSGSTNTGLNMEGAFPVFENGQPSSSKLHVVSDLGGDVLYNDGIEAKSLGENNFKKFRSDVLSGLDLQPCQSTSSDTTVAACGYFKWNDSTYTTSGTYVKMLLNAGGCDSTATLHLTIKDSSVCGAQGPSSSQSPYVIPVAPGVRLTSILTANDSVGGYRMVGIPDGLGAFDNADGTFTLLMNHELGNTVGVVRAHGSKGAFVSKWIINKSDLKVLSGSDLMQKVNLWNPSTSKYTTYSAANPSPLAAFSRFCSADLPEPGAFYNSATGLGTTERIFMNGEEANDESRAFAHIVTGPNSGTSWELPALGKGAWENAVATPNTGDKTVVCMLNDGTDGQVYFYIGSKSNTGTEIEKAGLTNGTPWGVKVSGFAKERVNSTTLNPLPAPGTRFSLVNLGAVKNITGATFNANSNAAGVTSFSRPEDGAWDPLHPNDFYFNTTDQLDQVRDGVGTQVGRSRVWRLRFDDVRHPESGGTIEAVIDGTEGANMLDNMAIDKSGHIILLEDVGNNAHNGKVWQYDIATDSLKQIAKHDPARFGDIGVPATPPFTIDEETSGVIDMAEILGPGTFLLVDQAHYTAGVPADIVEGGQLLALYDQATVASARSVTVSSPSNGAQIAAGKPIRVEALAAGNPVKVAFFAGGGKFAEDSVAPYEFSGSDVEPGVYNVTARAYYSDGDSAVSDTVRITITACSGSGTISAEGYTDIPGSSLINLASSAKYPNNPDVTAQLDKFEYGQNYGDNYGARVRGYLCAPVTGNYVFYLSSDDQSELYLSTDDSPQNIRRIAYVETRVGFRSWFTNASQRSVAIRLLKGATYYIETIHKEGTGNDHLSVGWVLPGGHFEAPIAGSHLSPFNGLSGQNAQLDFGTAMEAVQKGKKGFSALVTPNPSTRFFQVRTSGSSNAPVTLKVMDLTGRVVEVRQGVPANTAVQIGSNYRAGVYFIEATQNDQKVRMKVIKQ